MTEAGDHVREGFTRQRRALVATSLALLLYTNSGIRLDSVEIMGNSFTIARPGLIPLALWVLWAYFLVRYYQYFRDLRDPGWAEAKGTRVNTYIRRLARKRLLTELTQPH